MSPVNFEWALAQARQGFAIWRHGWSNNLQRVRIKFPAGDMTEPCFILSWKDKLGVERRAMWLPSNADIFAEDWDCE